MKIIETSLYNVIIDSTFEAFRTFISENKKKYSKFFVIADDNTENLCLPLFSKAVNDFCEFNVIVVPHGEANKNIETCLNIWRGLSAHYADRDALIINLGGGVVCDIGAFAASTYKRGCDYVNIPTTLLAMVDASVGGKTGVNLDNCKNQIGLFNSPKMVLINKHFLESLPNEEVYCGYAEVVKHALIADSTLWKDIQSNNFQETDFLISRCVEIKNAVVNSDPFEKNHRKILNFGHTIGHAVEMLSEDYMETPIKHGEALAVGMLAAACLSFKLTALPKVEYNTICNFVSEQYPYYPIPADLYEKLYKLVLHDKKNSHDNINMVLLSRVGMPLIDCKVSKEDIFYALDFYNSLYTS